MPSNRSSAWVALAIGLGSAAGAPAAAPDEPAIVRVHTRDRALIQSLADVHGHLVVDRGKGTVAFDADAKERAELAARGIAFDIDPVATENFNAPLRAAKAGIPGFACYRTVAETKARLDELATQFPSLLTLVDAGDSWERTQNLGGEDLRIARITNSAIAGSKPKLFVTASIHPRELPTAETALRFVERLLAGYGSDPDATWIVDRHEVHVLVLTNPDGRKKAETGLSWRKNTNNNFCANQNTRGIDLNRNMAFQWGGAGASTAPCNETFRGPSALSEPESFAVDAYQKLLFPDRRGPNLGDAAPADADGIYIDVHNNAAEVLWPYGFDTVSHAPNETALQTLGRRLAWFNGYEPMQSSELYAAAGATDDNAYGNLGVAAYTIELGGADFDASCTTFEADIAPDNVDALFYAARVVRAPYLLPAGPDVRAATATPPLAFPGDPVRVAARADDSRFNQSNGTEATQAIASARAYVDALPWVPASPSQALAATDGTFDATSEAISGTVDTTALAPGRHFVYLQARDAAGSDGPVSAVFVNVVDPATNGSLSGVVRDAAGAAVAAQVRANTYAAQADAGGGYLHRLPPGSYAVEVTAPHHERLQVANVPVVAGTTTARDFTMYALCQRAAQDAQSGFGAWTTQVTGGTNAWGIANPTGAFTTSHWTESVTGNYANNANTSLQSPVVDLTGYAEPVLSFDAACETEAGWDYGRVEVRTSPTGTWTEVWSCNGSLPRTHVEIALPQLAGQPQAQLRLRFTSDGSQVRDGVRIDDVLLEAGGATCQATQGPADPLFANGFE